MDYGRHGHHGRYGHLSGPFDCWGGVGRGFWENFGLHLLARGVS